MSIGGRAVIGFLTSASRISSRSQGISGGTYRARAELFLGVSYQYTGYRRISLSLLEQFPQKGGIVIAHARQRNVSLLADLAPKLIIRGHFGFGQHCVGGVPAVFTSGGHAIIDIAKAGAPRIRQPSPVTRIHQSPPNTTGLYGTR